jgi:hypothetical protein
MKSKAILIILFLFFGIKSFSTTITIVPLQDTICSGQYLYLQWTLSDTLNYGAFELQSSDANGSFANPVTYYSITINSPNLSGTIGVNIPTSTFPGSCYRFRMNRYTPAPLITGNPSTCVVIQACANAITTLQPTLTMDTNAVCAGSRIDVPFYSTGAYAGNIYIAQLSDVSGSFANPTDIGSVFSDITYDPMNPTPGYPPPGNVPCTIPDTVSAGCNYYVRIIATSPLTPPSPAIGSPWGPFCIQHCDIYLNSQDINVCLVPNTQPVTQNISVNIHHYNNNAVYTAGNQFQTQLLSMGPFPPPFTQVGTNGVFGSVTATSNATLQLTIPPLAQLQSLGIAPGRYYLRIVATNSNFPDSAFSNIIRLTIGAPLDTAPSYMALSYPSLQPLTSDTLCQGDLVYFFTSGGPGSSFRWNINSSLFSQNPLLLLFNASGTYNVRVQEYNFGCYGSLSSPRVFTAIGPPIVNILGPSSICVGDTVAYNVPFQNNTSLFWAVNNSHGHLVYAVFNSAGFIFDSAGTYQVSVHAVNQCFDTTGYRTITVHPVPSVPSIIQNGDTLTCSVPGTSYGWYKNSVLLPAYTTQSIILTLPADNGSWQVRVSNSFNCKSTSSPLTVVGMEEITETSISIFPNPAITELRIKNEELKIERIEIYDVFGKKLFSQISGLTSQISIDVSHLPPGIYFVTITNSEQQKFTKKFVKSN